MWCAMRNQPDLYLVHLSAAFVNRQQPHPHLEFLALVFESLVCLTDATAGFLKRIPLEIHVFGR